MPSTVLKIVVPAVLLLGLAACQPTGDPRCDDEWDILTEIESLGYTVDCDPDFDSGHDGITRPRTKQIFVWPEGIGNRNLLRYALWHESAHARGHYTELEADQWAWCREPLENVVWDLEARLSPEECRRRFGPV